MRKIALIPLAIMALTLVVCSPTAPERGGHFPEQPTEDPDPQPDPDDPPAPVNPELAYLNINKDTIVDFSRCGYHWSDRAIPDVPVKITLEAPADGSDAMAMIQNALDRVETPGAVLLKKGRYNISGTLKITRSGVVLRGEGTDTHLYSTATTQISCLIQVGSSASPTYKVSSRITDSYVPAGRFWVSVENPAYFSVGQTVFVNRPATEAWLDAIHMREIAQNSDGSVVQWDVNSYNLYWERKIVAIEGKKLFFDNPIVMSIGPGVFGSGSVYAGSWPRISECGVENMLLNTRFDDSKVSGNDYIDEDHCWSGINVLSAEHSWVQDITTWHFGYACVNLSKGSKNISVLRCKHYAPVSQVTGSRRYAFNMGGCQQSLFADCLCDDDRHEYVCGARVPGPNVFLRCKATNSRSEAGPHHRWSSGILFDNVVASGAINIHDRAGYGTGHGWTSANVVLYNCEGSSIVCQSPWASAVNWSIGSVGTRKNSARTYSDNLGPRPDGIWISPGKHVSPVSLFEDQLARRHAAGIYIDK